MTDFLDELEQQLREAVRNGPIRRRRASVRRIVGATLTVTSIAGVGVALAVTARPAGTPEQPASDRAPACPSVEPAPPRLPTPTPTPEPARRRATPTPTSTPRPVPTPTPEPARPAPTTVPAPEPAQRTPTPTPTRP